MTFKEFKFWLEGFSEAFENGHPNKKQWQRVTKRLKEVDVDEVINIPNPVVIREKEYIRPWWPTWYYSTTPYSIPVTSPSFICNSNSNIYDDGHTVTISTNMTPEMLYDSAKTIGQLEAKNESWSC